MTDRRLDALEGRWAKQDALKARATALAAKYLKRGSIILIIYISGALVLAYPNSHVAYYAKTLNSALTRP